MDYKEIIGIVATILILVSLSFNTKTFKTTLLLRIFNSIGCIVFVIYGILLPAISTAIANGGILIVNTYHIIKLVKDV